MNRDSGFCNLSDYAIGFAYLASAHVVLSCVVHFVL